jgi:hypothetical protein
MTSFVASQGSDYVLNCMFGQTELPVPNYFLALCTAMPDLGDDGSSIIEVGFGLGYSRLQVPNSQAMWLPSGYHEAVNAVDLVWPVVPDGIDWGLILACAVCDTPDIGTGRLLFYTGIIPATQPAPGVMLRLMAGQLGVGITSVTAGYSPT